MIAVLVLSLLVGQIPASSAGKTQVANLTDLLPRAEEFPGWSPGEERVIRTSRDLYDYMNGGAEIYIDYGFTDLVVSDWKAPEGDPLKIEIYKLGQPKSAYGLFTYDTWGEKVDVGQSARLAGGTLRFWKGEYFVRVFMWKGHERNRSVIMEMGMSISSRIKGTGDIPELVSLLPDEGLAEGGKHFFHTALLLGGFYYLSDGNPLQLTEETDGVIGEYLLDGETTTFLMVLSYPNEASAAEAYRNFLEEEEREAEAKSDGGSKASLSYEDGMRRLLARRQSLLVLALDCPSGDGCEHLFGKALEKVEMARKRTQSIGRREACD